MIKPTTIDPKILALPVAGLEEYAYWYSRYAELQDGYTECLRLLKQLQVLDTEKDYNPRINETFCKAFLNDMDWEIKRRRILAKWLRDEDRGLWHFRTKNG